jgi:hypothetical protein
MGLKRRPELTQAGQQKQAQSKTRATMHLEFQLLRLTAASLQTGVRIASHVACPTSQARILLSAQTLVAPATRRNVTDRT